MSLETEIKKFADAVIGLTAAIEANTHAAQAFLAFNQQSVPCIVTYHNETPAAPQPVAETPVVVKEEAAAAPQPVAETPVVVKEEAAAAPQPVAETPVAVTLADLQKLGKQLIDAGRQPELVAAVKSLGHPAMSKMPVELYPQMLAKLQELTGGAK